MRLGPRRESSEGGFLVDRDTRKKFEEVEAPGRKAAHTHIGNLLARFAYWKREQPERGLLRRCLLLTAELPEKPRVGEQAISRPRRSSDEVLAESKFGSVIRRFLDFGHISARQAERLDEFTLGVRRRVPTVTGVPLSGGAGGRAGQDTQDLSLRRHAYAA